MPIPTPITLTTASNTDTTTYTLIPLSRGSDVNAANNALGSQVMRITGNINASAGTAANVRFVLRTAAKIYKFVDVTVAVSAVRTVPAGGSGNYVVTVSGTNDDFIDLSGHDDSAGMSWYVGLAGAFGGSATSLELNLIPIRAI